MNAPHGAGPVTVSVPATTANLGPGFDSLGLALSLRNTLSAELTGAGLEVHVEGEGAEDLPRDERHLVVRAMRAGFDALHVHPTGLRLHCRNVIPQGRGLGSSAAAIVGGLVLARSLVAGGVRRWSDRELLAVADRMEGHPDNVAPALLGGLVVSGRDDADGHTVWTQRVPVHPEMRAVVLVPPYQVGTKEARDLLPASVPHADAATNTGRAALLVAALQHAPHQLMRATEDRLHQEYRRPAMPATLDLVAALRAEGVPATVSGAGPTVLALVGDGGPDPEAALRLCPEGWQALALQVEDTGARRETAGSR